MFLGCLEIQPNKLYIDHITFMAVIDNHFFFAEMQLFLLLSKFCSHNFPVASVKFQAISSVSRRFQILHVQKL